MKRPVLGMILKGYPRISETFISNEIELLEAHGFDIRILSMRQPRESFTHDSVKRIKAQRHYLPETILLGLWKLLPTNILCALRQPRRYARAVAEMLRRLMRTRKAATIKHLLQAGYLAGWVLPGTGVTHLHAHFAHSPASVASFTAIITGLPFSFTAHAKDIYTQDPERLAEKIAAARFVATCTEYNRSYLESLNRTGTPLHRVYHGIDVRLFTPPQREAKTPGDPYRLLTVARLTAKKGLPTVLRAVAELKRGGLDVRHAVIGSGEQEAELRALAQQLGIAECVEWLGTRTHQEVVEHMARADLFLLGCEVSGNGDRDGIPNVLVEAMSMELPVAATAVSAIPELIVDGAHGLLAPPRDPEALALAARRLLTDQKLRDTVAVQARQRVLEHFDNRTLVGELAEVFRAAMS